jgi:large subunit ribosomal protein L25
MEKYQLNAKKRAVLGKKVKRLRKSGFLPANIYGKKVKSESVELALVDFEKVFKRSGKTGLIELLVDGKSHPVLIHNIQYDPVKSTPLHADFYQVDLHEKVAAKVPVVLIGVAPAVSGKVGVMLTLLNQIEVEALPADLPDKVEIKVDHLSEVNQSIKVSDIKLSDKVKILADSKLDVVKIAPLVSKEAEKLAAEEEVAKAAAAAEAAAAAPAAEGEVASAAEAPTAETAAAAPTEVKKEETPKPSGAK